MVLYQTVFDLGVCAWVRFSVYGLVYEKSSYRGFLIIEIIKVPIGIPGTAYRGFLIVASIGNRTGVPMTKKMLILGRKLT